MAAQRPPRPSAQVDRSRQGDHEHRRRVPVVAEDEEEHGGDQACDHRCQPGQLAERHGRVFSATKMTGALSPEQALDRLLEMSADVRQAVVLDHRGRRLAGSRALAGPAKELLEAVDAPEIEVATGRGGVFAVRSDGGAIVVVTHRSVLPALMLYDLRVVLDETGVGA